MLDGTLSREDVRNLLHFPWERENTPDSHPRSVATKALVTCSYLYNRIERLEDQALVKLSMQYEMDKLKSENKRLFLALEQYIERGAKL